MRYKVMVVDDEPMQLKGLSNMIKKIRPSYELFEAKNGMEAMEIIDRNQMDIIITDIKMPLMDGLMMIEKLGTKLDKMKVIIISGYRDFEYAQKAVSLGAFDYLLKPVSQEKIIQMIEKTEKSIELNLIKVKEKEQIAKQLNSTLPVYLDHKLNKWVNLHISYDELKEIESIFPYKNRGVVFSLSIDRYNELVKNCDYEKINEYKHKIKCRIKDFLDTMGNCISFFLEGKENVIVSILSINDDIEALSLSNKEKYTKFIRSIKNLYGIDVTMSIGGEYKDIYSEVKISFKQSMEALSYKFYYGTGELICYSDISYKENKKLLNISKKEKELVDAIRKMQKGELLSTINSIFEGDLNKEFLSPYKFIRNVIYLVLNSASNIQDLVEEDYYDELISTIEEQLSSCEDYWELKDKVLSFFLKIINTLENLKDKKHEFTMEKCIQYIEAHFSEDISLEAVAEAIYLSQSYFSLSFKKYTGMTFSQYIYQLRVKKAIELLLNTDFKVYEIASEVGYKDDKYFYRVFKKEFGISPDEYRRRMRSKSK